MDFHIIIPARFASERLPGKVLIEVAGKPLIQYVYERALLCGAKSVMIAVDDERVKKAAEAFGATVCMTRDNHATGTDRLAEAAEKLQIPDNDVIVNIQGDEPLMLASAVHQVVNVMIEQKDNVGVATLCTLIHHEEENN